MKSTFHTFVYFCIGIILAMFLTFLAHLPDSSLSPLEQPIQDTSFIYKIPIHNDIYDITISIPQNQIWILIPLHDQYNAYIDQLPIQECVSGTHHLSFYAKYTPLYHNDTYLLMSKHNKENYDQIHLLCLLVELLLSIGSASLAILQYRQMYFHEIKYRYFAGCALTLTGLFIQQESSLHLFSIDNQVPICLLLWVLYTWFTTRFMRAVYDVQTHTDIIQILSFLSILIYLFSLFSQPAYIIVFFMMIVCTCFLTMLLQFIFCVSSAHDDAYRLVTIVFSFMLAMLMLFLYCSFRSYPIYYVSEFSLCACFYSSAMYFYLQKDYQLAYFSTLSKNKDLEYHQQCQDSELLKMNHQLIQLEQSRKHMLADITHDLRAPIATIRSASEILISGIALEQSNKFHQIVYDKSLQLEKLTNDIFELATLENHITKFHFERVPIVPFLEEYYYSFLSNYADENAHFSFTFDAELIEYVYIDTQRIRQVLDNLYTNALKYAENSCTITLHVESNDRKIIVSVHDTGIGIKEQYLEMIFERMYTISKARTPSQDGRGLGLAIAKSIIEQHNGIIWAESKEGCGSTFYFTLPIIT